MRPEHHRLVVIEDKRRREATEGHNTAHLPHEWETADVVCYVQKATALSTPRCAYIKDGMTNLNAPKLDMKHYIILAAYLIAMGMIDALLMYILCIPTIQCNIIHGAIIALFALENWNIHEDLEKLEPPKLTATGIETDQTETRLLQKLRMDILDFHKRVTADREQAEKSRRKLRHNSNRPRSSESL
jgi:hypothetical protein